MHQNPLIHIFAILGIDCFICIFILFLLLFKKDTGRILRAVNWDAIVFEVFWGVGMYSLPGMTLLGDR